MTVYGIREEHQFEQPPAPPASGMSQQVLADLQMTHYCRACSKFSALQHAASALADADDVPASVFFQIGSILEPSRMGHLQRMHPHLFEHERQMELARQAVLGMHT